LSNQRQIKKQVKFGATPSLKKEPVFTQGFSFNDHRPSWRVNRLQLIDPYGWHELSLHQIRYIQGKLVEFERKTWNEILVFAKKQNHSVPVSGLKCPRARKWMRENMPDQEELWSLRLSGAERIWGVYSEGVFNLIFWDPEHLIWESER